MWYGICLDGGGKRRAVWYSILCCLDPPPWHSSNRPRPTRCPGPNVPLSVVRLRLAADRGTGAIQDSEGHRGHSWLAAVEQEGRVVFSLLFATSCATYVSLFLKNVGKRPESPVAAVIFFLVGRFCIFDFC